MMPYYKNKQDMDASAMAACLTMEKKKGDSKCELCKTQLQWDNWREHRAKCFPKFQNHLLSLSLQNGQCYACSKDLICFPFFFQSHFQCKYCNKERMTEGNNLIKCFNCNIDRCANCYQRQRHAEWVRQGCSGFFDAHLRFRELPSEPPRKRHEDAAAGDDAPTAPPSYEESLRLAEKLKPSAPKK